MEVKLLIIYIYQLAENLVICSKSEENLSDEEVGSFGGMQQKWSRGERK